MRTISKRTQYGLRAILALGRKYGEGPVLIATLAKEEGIPVKFLEGILFDLKGRDLAAKAADISSAVRLITSEKHSQELLYEKNSC